MIYKNTQCLKLQRNENGMPMDYGRPIKPFFIEIQNFCAWADEFWGMLGIFGENISTYIDTVSALSMFSVFHYLTIICTQK